MKRIILSVIAALCGVCALAQTPVVQPDLSIHTKIAPKYFGPNAFPVPEIPLARIPKAITAELSGDMALGLGKSFGADLTYGPSFLISVPLWTDRAALTVWMPVVEWWKYDSETALERRLAEKYLGGGRGYDSGDVYVSMDIHVLKAKGWRPDIMVRAVLKSASGNHFGEARYYDAPGYFFDCTIANSLRFNGFFTELRAAVSGGFLCWQTDNGRQNDAIQAGVAAMLDSRIFRLEVQGAGYFGWEGDGDRPVTVRARLDFHAGNFSPFASCVYGIHDYPFCQFRIGLRYYFPLQKLKEI